MFQQFDCGIRSEREMRLALEVTRTLTEAVMDASFNSMHQVNTYAYMYGNISMVPC